MWIKNSDGEKSASLTFAAVAFAVVCLKVLLANANISISGHQFDFGSIDGAVIAALLTPTLGAYITRRYTDKKFPIESDSASADSPRVEPPAQ